MIYNTQVLEWITRISEEDYLSSSSFSQAYFVGGSSGKIYFDSSATPPKFAITGSAYLIAMVKWLQHQFVNNKHLLYHYDFPLLIKVFSLPPSKRRDALLLLELVEKIKSDY